MTILLIIAVVLMLCICETGWSMKKANDSTDKDAPGEFVVNMFMMLFLIWLVINLFRVRAEFGALLAQ
jgi:heme/copper-type cytochrome/quinol oxidase subunit 2